MFFLTQLYKKKFKNYLKNYFYNPYVKFYQILLETLVSNNTAVCPVSGRTGLGSERMQHGNSSTYITLIIVPTAITLILMKLGAQKFCGAK